jgi:transmembrane sensor
MERMKTRSNEEVARWVVRLDAGPLSPDEERELDAWLDAAPHHRGALIRARAAWTDLDRIGALAGGSSSGVSRYSPTTTRRYLLAASLAAVTLGAGYFAYTLTRDVYDTGIGEVRRVTLADGSSMVLNSGTKAIVRFVDSQREIRLERGEALFEVRKDKVRPFTVRTNGLTVRAVGTAFAVRIAEEKVAITVTEGVVEVGRAVDEPQRVGANHRVVVKSAAPVAIEPIAPAIVNRQLAWRDGMVAFDGELLGEAVVEINRHSRQPIVVDDPALGAMPIVGIFRVGDVEGFANAAAIALGAEVQTDGAVIRLTRVGESH